MSLTLPTNTFNGFAGGNDGIDAIADGLNPCLKALEITFWLEFDDAPAITAAVALQGHDGFDTVKAGIHKSMSPHIWIVAVGAMIRPRPWEFFEQKEKKIDINRNGDYHEIPFWGLLAETPVSRKNGVGWPSVCCFSSPKLNGPLWEAHLI
jgi:hypothetical protein